MTELEVMQRAKMYIDKLANGIDPITDQELPEDTVLNNVRLARCFFYVSQVLGKVIANNGRIGSQGKNKKQPFTITSEQLEQVAISEEPIPVSRVAENINATIDVDVYKRLNGAQINEWLVEKGFLMEQIDNEGKKTRTITENSVHIGITREERTSPYGRQYFINLFDSKAQKFILDNIDEIISFINNKTNTA